MEATVTYDWVDRAKEKYGEAITNNLIKQQQRFEEKVKGNDCKYCGERNTGTVVEIGSAQPILMHYGLRNGSGNCSHCGKY